METFLWVSVAVLVSAGWGHASRWVRVRYGRLAERACGLAAVVAVMALLQSGGRWVPVAFAIAAGFVVGSLFPPLTPLRPVPEEDPTGTAGAHGPA